MKGYSSTFKILTTLIAGISLFNLIRKYFDSGLNGIVVDLIDYYQKIFFPIIDFINSRVDWLIPDWNKNFIVLLITICAIHSRSLAHHFQQKFEKEGNNDGNKTYIGQHSKLYQIRAGIEITLAWLGGAKEISGGGHRLTNLSTVSMSITGFLLMLTGSLFIPYLRTVLAFSMCLSALLFALSIFVEFRGVEYTNRKVFALNYLGTILAAIAVFALNKYSS